MEAVIFVEVLDRKGHVRERVAVTRLPVEIGRAYSNAVILDDPYVSPVHVRLERDEKGLWLEDLDSANGLIVHPGDDAVKRAEVRSGTCFRVGNTLLRFVATDHAVPPALKHWVWVRRFERMLGSSRFQTAMVLLVVTEALLSRYFNTFRKVEWGEVLADEFSGLLAFGFVYLGFWSLIAVTFTGQARFRRNVAVLGLVALVTTAWRLAQRTLAFAFDLDLGGMWSGVAQGFALVALMFYGHVRTSTDARPLRSLFVALVIAATITAGIAMKEYKDTTEFSSYARISSTVLPPGLRLARPATLDGFLAGAQAVRDKVDKEAKD